MAGSKHWNKKDGEEHRVLLELFATSVIHPGNWFNNKLLKEIHSNPSYPFSSFSNQVFIKSEQDSK